MDVVNITESLGQGMLVSLEIFSLTLLFSLPLGLIFSFGRMSKNIVLRSI
ncbi:MAG: amino acid ABC transporter permease, partial [Lachnoclostridium sp.]|nr:amino acid ABC transporter permease [Lachnoclostridium sp.]